MSLYFRSLYFRSLFFRSLSDRILTFRTWYLRSWHFRSWYFRSWYFRSCFLWSLSFRTAHCVQQNCLFVFGYLCLFVFIYLCLFVSGYVCMIVCVFSLVCNQVTVLSLCLPAGYKINQIITCSYSHKIPWNLHCVETNQYTV